MKKQSLRTFPAKTGKVRDLFELDSKRLLVVASDRISAYDSILPTLIPQKGVILTQISRYWFNLTSTICPNHVIDSTDQQFIWHHDDYPDLKDRLMVVKRAEKLPIEAIVRGYICGSAWKEYQQFGTISGIKLQPGLKEASKLPRPIFSPSTKADTGHDENITFEEMVEIVGQTAAAEVREASLKLYDFAAQKALQAGIIIADSKFEFGYIDGKLCVIDELFTPDSSRFWPADLYREGQSQHSFDKQYVRDYLDSIAWQRTPPAPALPAHVVDETLTKYHEMLNRLQIRI
ncbi:phosphoribosylaminoimidazolesuccinocarboxamide synthase [Chitinispirillales bacterium ANBcel5]|uniref:phosphoribosylaminoimidazolesuccinocarboxamide synthase n=1 Tax=Cellulosispirillum alkaliphilum TaxID=3039283 RepID=UPI002A4FC45C|nr:phosphoribosylaminoimidazolesuccinocarboxamide synthase [Chitinispirillales bacterium ANBcel5]